MTQIADDVRSLSRLFGDALETLSKLIRTEIQLARAELTQKAGRAAVGVGMLLGALFLLTPALVLFLIALAIGLTQAGLSPILAHVLAGAVALIAAGVLTALGIQRLKPDELAPRTTIDEVRQDIAAAKEMAS